MDRRQAIDRQERNKEIVRRIFIRYSRIYLHAFEGRLTTECRTLWWVTKKNPELQALYLHDFTNYLVWTNIVMRSYDDELLLKKILDDLEKYVKNDEVNTLSQITLSCDIKKIPPISRNMEIIWKFYWNLGATESGYAPKNSCPLKITDPLIEYSFHELKKSYTELTIKGSTVVPVLYKPLQYKTITTEPDFIEDALEQRILYPFWPIKIKEFDFTSPSKERLISAISKNN